MPADLIPARAVDSATLPHDPLVGGDGAVDATCNDIAGCNDSASFGADGRAPSAGRRVDFDTFFRSAVDRLHAERRYRVFADIERIAGRFPQANWRKPDGRTREITVWCSNDYLGMGQHPDVVEAMTETVKRCGVGAGGTRNIAGNNSPLVDLERELADLHGKEAGLVFTSGYVSNQAGISTIAKLLPNCLILSDAFNHNSMIEGVRHS
ncbi:MAG: aminotransferase class I/II-fold pyridoxal phosphate-dependent enzyme, partial [Methylobacterium sp.]